MSGTESVVEQFVKSGGRIFRRREVYPTCTRTITVAYRRTADGQIQYGAAIHRKESPSECFVRKQHNHTAVIRAIEQPVTVSDIEVDRHEQREEMLRNALRTHGCSAR